MVSSFITYFLILIYYLQNYVQNKRKITFLESLFIFTFFLNITYDIFTSNSSFLAVSPVMVLINILVNAIYIYLLKQENSRLSPNKKNEYVQLLVLCSFFLLFIFADQNLLSEMDDTTYLTSLIYCLEEFMIIALCLNRPVNQLSFSLMLLFCIFFYFSDVYFIYFMFYSKLLWIGMVSSVFSHASKFLISLAFLKR